MIVRLGQNIVAGAALDITCFYMLPAIFGTKGKLTTGARLSLGFRQLHIEKQLTED